VSPRASATVSKTVAQAKPSATPCEAARPNCSVRRSAATNSTSPAIPATSMSSEPVDARKDGIAVPFRSNGSTAASTSALLAP